MGPSGPLFGAIWALRGLFDPYLTHFWGHFGVILGSGPGYSGCSYWMGTKVPNKLLGPFWAPGNTPKIALFGGYLALFGGYMGPQEPQIGLFDPYLGLYG